MKISDLQTMDFILKRTVSTKEPYKNSTLKILIKCDDAFMYGDFVRNDNDYVYVPTFSPFTRSIEPEYIGTSLQSDETKQIDLFKKIRQPFGTELVKEFFMFINSENNLELLNSYMVSLVNDLQEENKLPHNLYDVTFVNMPDLPNISVIDLDSFKSVQLISIFEVQQN
ncbi:MULTISPECIES: hypothetical protein [Enterococcus]|uniref:hypothetical protein n=1 Tax=Enterococcus TaxID=1350 RepID=UPI000EE3423B|nr:MULTISPECIES: hypothetical protein [Enterococcus]HCM85559.1 hypothetical protein [Enterococcus sp.]